jgi:double-stranded uracil-DNA glycosylase
MDGIGTQSVKYHEAESEARLITPIRRPSREEIQAAAGKSIPDVIAPGLKVLFCGINPGLYTAAIGHHFGRPGNRFWPALHAAGITPRLLSPYQEQDLLLYGYGITNLVMRATAAADELTREELAAGGQILEEKVRRYTPRFLAILGVTAYRSAFNRPKAVTGPQTQLIGGAVAWVLPNPSGLNAHYQIEDLAQMYRQLKEAAEE